MLYRQKAIRGLHAHSLVFFFHFFLIEMLEGKPVVQETDMPDELQSHVMELAYQALDLHEVSDCQSIAHYIKQVLY